MIGLLFIALSFFTNASSAEQTPEQLAACQLLSKAIPSAIDGNVVAVLYLSCSQTTSTLPDLKTNIVSGCFGMNFKAQQFNIIDPLASQVYSSLVQSGIAEDFTDPTNGKLPTPSANPLTGYIFLDKFSCELQR